MIPADADKARFDTPQRTLLACCDLFSVCRVDCRDTYAGAAGEESFVSLLVLEGNGSFTCAETAFPLAKGESVFIPANSGAFTVTGEIQLLETRI